MKVLGNYNKIAFDNLEELKSFIKNGYGDVMFYNDWTGDYYPVIIANNALTDDKETLVLGSDGFDEVEEEHLENIYAYERIK